MMTENSVVLADMNRPPYDLNTLVIGSGAAGLNAADCLYDLGVRDIAIVTEGLNMGTSRNTGSDKQTYYKLSLASDASDSVKAMAETLFAGGGVNGDCAYVEAACSVKSFMKLVALGVSFPTNEYGDYVGYMTDHDAHKRATSAGPLTSKYMTEALERSVKNKNIKIFDNTVIFKLLERGGRIVGAVGIDRTKINGRSLGFQLYRCENVVLATGGPACVYKNSVYPVSQTGMTGMALEIGAESANLQEWQYGLASVDFRWNVSGTYQQVIPRYISIDGAGNEREFLNDYFEDSAEAANLIFKKGYQWPFDSAKIKGSSMIDMIIYNETVAKGRKVYMDFRGDPSGLRNGFGALSDEARAYLKKSGALLDTPIKRLEKMNEKAIDLYRAHGIDLSKEPLRVAVCAQHNNGGLAVDKNWETGIKGLYAVGEAAGTFGVYRPGGTALNSTQVGSLRAAEHIAFKALNGAEPDGCAFWAAVRETGAFMEKLCGFSHGKKENPLLQEIKSALQKEMSGCAGFIRNREKIGELKERTGTLRHEIFEMLSEISQNQIPEFLKLRDMLITQNAILAAMEKSLEVSGSRGGSVCFAGGLEEGVLSAEPEPKKEHENIVVCTKMENARQAAFTKPARPLPEPDTWFETVWNDYLKRRRRA